MLAIRSWQQRTPIVSPLKDEDTDYIAVILTMMVRLWVMMILMIAIKVVKVIMLMIIIIV